MSEGPLRRRQTRIAPWPSLGSFKGFIAGVALVVLATVLALSAGSADAHSFLVATNPAQGERLAASPGSLVLSFSEQPDPSAVVVDVSTSDGQPVQIHEPELHGLDVRVPVVELDDGIYLVNWEATSAVDGHGSAGEYAFAVGDVEGAVPVARTSAPTSWWGLAASLPFTVGLALALGTLALRGVARGVADVPLMMPVSGGLLVAIAGAVIALVAPGGASAWELIVVVDLLAVAVACLLLARGRYWIGPLVCGLVAAGMWALRSHAARDHGVLGWLTDFVHLAAGATWAGSLAVALITGWRLRRRSQPWRPLVSRYARLALALVVALGLAGVVSALLLVPTWEDLWHTGYGRLVVTKAALFAVALVAAGIARWRALRLRADRSVHPVMTGELLTVAAAVVVAGLLSSGAPPLSAASTEQLLGPPPLRGNVTRDAGLAGRVNVEVASDGEQLQLDVLTGQGPLSDAGMTLAVQHPDGSTTDLVPRPCGPGCFTQALPLQEGTSRLAISVSASSEDGGSYRAALRWPPGRRAPRRLDALVERMRRVPELTLTEITNSGPGARSEPGTFVMNGDRFVDTEPYAGANVDDVRAIDENRLLLYLPGDRILIDVALDGEGRIARERIVSRGHEITREFTYPADSD